MRLFEFVTPKFYLCTEHRKKIGKTIERVVRTYPLGAVCEGWLERRRPETALARETSFYLQTHPDHHASFVYLVEPVGQVDRHHSAWLKMLSEADQGSKGEMDHYACAYWSGQERPEDRDEPWEYRALTVKILALAGGHAQGATSSDPRQEAIEIGK